MKALKQEQFDDLTEEQKAELWKRALEGDDEVLSYLLENTPILYERIS